MNAKVINLVGERQREYAVEVIKGLKADPQDPVEIVIRKKQRKRTDPQRALFWIWMRAIREHLIESTGELYSEQELHDWFCDKFLGTKEVNVLGEARRRAIGTSDLSKDEMREFLDRIDMHCASELDLFLPTSNSL